ncbi:MAG TPA: glycosyltransferase [Gemmatimonadales bacterium]
MINFNGERYLERSLAAVLAQGDAVDEILLVDNASDDASLRLARDLHPRVRVVRRRRNDGPAAARNAGFAAAASDRILFLDNDMVLAEGAAARLSAALDADPAAAIAVPRILDGRHPDTVQFDGADCHFLGGMALHHAGRPDAEVPPATREIGSLGAGCFAVDRRRLGMPRPFDEAFLFNYEDHDFGVHARLRGNRILAVSAAKCLHLDGTPGLSMRPGGRYHPFRVYCLIRNRWLVLLKYFEWRTLALLAPLLLVYELAQLAVAAAKGWLGEWCRAAGWMLRHLPDVLEQRRAIQESRRIPDRRLLAGGPLPFRPELTPRGPERVAKRAFDRLSGAYWRLARPLVRSGASSQRLAGNMGVALGSQLFYKLTGYITLALLTRYLAKPEMGQFFFAATLAGTAVLFTELGTHRALVRAAASDPARALDAVSEVVSFRLPLFAIYFVLINAFTWVTRPELLPVMVLTSVYVGLEELYLSFGSLFVGIQRLLHNALAGFCCRLALIALILLAIRADLGFRAVLVAHVLANAVLVGVGYAIVRRRLGPVRLRWTRARAKALTVESLPLFAVAILGMVHAKVDTVMLGFLGSYSDVARYQAASKLLDASRFLVRPLTTVLFPVLAALGAGGDLERLRAYSARTLANSGWLGAGVGALLAIGAGMGVQLAFGSRYADAAPLLRVLALSTPLLYVGTIALMVSMALRREREVARLLAVCVAANIGANLIAIPRWGPLGAAWTTVGSELLLTALLLQSNARWLQQPLRATEPAEAAA